jgi:RNA polymerase sigma-70 factor (ECF subfamily)
LSDFEIEDFTLEDCVVNQILLEKAQEFIQSKSEDVERIFYLYYDSNLTVPEIAKMLNMSDSNVKHRIYRTLKELKDLFEEGG